MALYSNGRSWVLTDLLRRFDNGSNEGIDVGVDEVVVKILERVSIRRSSRFSKRVPIQNRSLKEGFDDCCDKVLTTILTSI